VTSGRLIRISIAAILLAGAVMAGCTHAPITSAAPAPTGGSGVASATSTITVDAFAGATGTAPGTSNGASSGTPGTKGGSVSKEDLAAIRRQLDAMQKEIDSLAMPSDNDFNGAAGAVY
jgi:ABC-type transport system substrate-binding protein